MSVRWLVGLLIGRWLGRLLGRWLGRLIGRSIMDLFFRRFPDSFHLTASARLHATNYAVHPTLYICTGPLNHPQLLHFEQFLTTFLDAFSHLYKRVCPSVGPSVRRSVRPSVRLSVTHELKPCKSAVFDQNYCQYERERILWPCIRPCSVAVRISAQLQRFYH